MSRAAAINAKCRDCIYDQYSPGGEAIFREPLANEPDPARVVEGASAGAILAPL
jgi:hypothetical protein